MGERRKPWYATVQGWVAIVIQIGAVIATIAMASGAMMSDIKDVKSQVKELQDWRVRESQETTEIHEDVRWIRAALGGKH